MDPKLHGRLADVRPCVLASPGPGRVEFTGAPGHREFGIPTALGGEQMLPAVHTGGSLPFPTGRCDSHRVPFGGGISWGGIHPVGA
eukprot:scaffold2846_cov322-Pavlova_lutheri.AAC.29